MTWARRPVSYYVVGANVRQKHLHPINHPDFLAFFIYRVGFKRGAARLFTSFSEYGLEILYSTWLTNVPQRMAFRELLVS